MGQFTQFLLHQFDAAVAVAKQVFEQVLAVELVRAQPLLRLLQQGAHFRNQLDALLRRLLDAREQVQQPRLPLPGVAHGLQVAVVVGFVLGDEPA